MKQDEENVKQKNKKLSVDKRQLEKELEESYKESRRNSTRAQTSNTGLTRRGMASRDAIYSRDKSALMER